MFVSYMFIQTKVLPWFGSTYGLISAFCVKKKNAGVSTSHYGIIKEEEVVLVSF